MRQNPVVYQSRWVGQTSGEADTTYDYHPQTGHFSGVCNHTLVPGGGGGGGGRGGGVHGQSVGARMIDLLPNKTTATKVRFRCLGSMAADGSASLASFSAHLGDGP